MDNLNVCIFVSQTQSKMKQENLNTPQGPTLQQADVMCNSFEEILAMLDRGNSVFESGYLITLGEMKRQGLVEVNLCKDGSAVVRKNFR